MPVQVDHSTAQDVLNRAWNEVNAVERPPARMQKLIEDVLAEEDITYKYILATGYLAKCVNPKAHARTLQVSSKLRGAYDARSLCHKVLVGFEKSKGNLFGLSNEPFVNKPARHPQHEGDNKQLRNKLGAGFLHQALEEAQLARPAEVFQGLVHILRLGKQHAADQKEVIVSTEANGAVVLEFIEEFLKVSDGGARLVGIWGAFQSLLCEDGDVRVYPPNASDRFSNTAGDVEVYYEDVLVSASECKDRPLNVDDVNHGIKKARGKNVPEYIFVMGGGMDGGQDLIEKALLQHADEVDVVILDVREELKTLIAVLNPYRRSKFGAEVVEILRKMRKFESANAAADLWNKLTS